MINYDDIHIGDTVKVINLNRRYYGKKGRVTEIAWDFDPSHGPRKIRVIFDDSIGMAIDFDPIELEVIKEEMTLVQKDYFDYSALSRATASPNTIKIVNVIFNPPATIVEWSDGKKTVVKAQNREKFDPEKGLAMAIAKKVLGNKGNYYNIFKHYVKEYEKAEKIKKNRKPLNKKDRKNEK